MPLASYPRSPSATASPARTASSSSCTCGRSRSSSRSWTASRRWDARPPRSSTRHPSRAGPCQSARSSRGRSPSISAESEWEGTSTTANGAPPPRGSRCPAGRPARPAPRHPSGGGARRRAPTAAGAGARRRSRIAWWSAVCAVTKGDSKVASDRIAQRLCVQALTMSGALTTPPAAVVPARSLLARVSMPTSSALATPDLTMSGSMLLTVSAIHSYPSDSGPPATTDSRRSSGSGRPASRKARRRPEPTSAGIPALRMVPTIQPQLSCHSGVGGEGRSDSGVKLNSWKATMPPGPRRSASKRRASAGSVRYISTSLPITASKRPPRVAWRQSPATKETLSRPADRARAEAVSRICGLASTRRRSRPGRPARRPGGRRLRLRCRCPAPACPLAGRRRRASHPPREGVQDLGDEDQAPLRFEEAAPGTMACLDRGGLSGGEGLGQRRRTPATAVGGVGGRAGGDGDGGRPGGDAGTAATITRTETDWPTRPQTVPHHRGVNHGSDPEHHPDRARPGRGVRLPRRPSQRAGVEPSSRVDGEAHQRPARRWHHVPGQSDPGRRILLKPCRRLASSAMPIGRMNREQFFGQLATLDEQRLKKALWNLYWRGSAATRQRIEAEIDPDQHDRGKRPSKEPADPQQLLDEVADFVALARSGAYLAGDRRVSPKERTRWRLTFKRLVAAAQDGLRAPDPSAVATALAQLIDLACQTRDYDYFRSEDPMEAAGVVVSDAVALLWGTLHARYGFAGFAERAAPQLIRWESRHGWTRSGWGRVSQKETSLASVLAQMLAAPDMWVGFTDRYLDALDRLARDAPTTPNRAWRPRGHDRDQRTAALAEWHHLLLDRLIGSEAEDRLDRLTRRPALGGPELGFLQAQLAHLRGQVSNARSLVHAALQQLPGHQDFLDFATEIGAPLPPRAQQIVEERSR